jgi:hypothetical protein
MMRRYGLESDDNKDWKDRAWEKVEDVLQWLYNKTINVILDKHSDQKISIRIDKYDTWSMDHTLAPIILPMLKQLKETKHGSPFVDDFDVPKELRSTSAPPKENDYDIDDNHHKRWEWVLDEMIWAFGQKTRDGWEGDYCKFEDDPTTIFGVKLVWEDREGSKAHQKRMTNGFKLFGKYYEALWD